MSYSPLSARSLTLDLPTTHRIPLTWLLEHGGPAIRARTLLELAPEGASDPHALSQAVREAVLDPQVAAVTTRQQESGLWDANFLSWQTSQRDHTNEPGTVAQYRRLVQLGVPGTTRPFRLANKVLFRTLSRDDDPLLYGEFFDATVNDFDTAEWYRSLIREAASAALAEAGYDEDPRLRGSAHKVITQVSAFLRSELADNPLAPRGSSAWQLNKKASPPTWWSVAMLAAMPSLQRERAGFVDRLVAYLNKPVPEHSFVIVIGKTTMRPTHLLLGDPIELDAKGAAKDVPLAMLFSEMVAGLGQLDKVASASKFVLQLLEDVDDDGVWHPKNLRSQPKAFSPVSHHSWPLAADDGELASRQADITFRLALIAKRMGWRLEYS